MNALVVALALLAAPPVSLSASSSPSSSSAAPAVADPKAPAETVVGRSPDALPTELGFAALVLGVAGGGVLVAAQAHTGPVREGADALRQTALVWTGSSLVGLAGLVAGSALATSVFDPSTGRLRWKLFSDDE